MAPTVGVVDILEPTRAPKHVVIDDASTSTLGELRALVLSLPLPSVKATPSGEQPRICHDGRVLEDDDRTLDSLRVMAAPIVVVLAPAPRRRPRTPPPPIFTAASVAGAASAAAAAVTGAAAGAVAVAAAVAAEPEETCPPADATCRICFGAAHEGGLGKLISPCMCIGSMRYVHIPCLNDWRQESANPRSFYRARHTRPRAHPPPPAWA